MYQPELLLYLGPGSSSMAPHIALHEAGAVFETSVISFAAQQQHTPEFLAVNPEGKVPVLLVDGQVLTEVAGILYFIARTFPDARLWPFDSAFDEAQAISWMSFIAATLHPARRRGLEAVREVWVHAERRLRARQWAAGNRHSIADIHLFRLYWRMRASLHPDPSEFPKLEAHHARMLERKAVQVTLAAEAAIGYELP